MRSIASHFVITLLANRDNLLSRNGTNRARTYDPLLVRQMLSQLSYDPIYFVVSLEPTSLVQHWFFGKSTVFLIFSNFFYNFFYNRNKSKSLCVNLIQKNPRKHKACGAFLKILYDSLSCHSIYNFFKSCNVSSGNIVTFHSVTFCSIVHVVADVYHDVFQFCIYFFKCPAKSLTVL